MEILINGIKVIKQNSYTLYDKEGNTLQETYYDLDDGSTICVTVRGGTIRSFDS